MPTDNYKKIIDVNVLLTKRLNGKYFYSLGVLSLTLILCIITSIVVFNKNFEVTSTSAPGFMGFILIYSMLVYYPILVRHFKGTYVYPNKLFLYPISRNNILKSLYLSGLRDIRMLLYLLPLLFLFVGMVRHGILKALTFSTLFTLYLICIEVWMLNLYLAFPQILTKFKNYLFFFPFLVYQFFHSLKPSDLTTIPFLNWVQKGLECSMRKEIIPLLGYYAGFSLVIITGYYTGKFLLKRMKWL